jgi:hypothetical protein
MRKLSCLIILSLFFGFILNSCEKCSSYNDYYVISETKPYFDVYKEGNWWVYQNQDSTKRDSIFITNYNDKLWDVDREYCNRYEHREFILNSNYILEEKNPKAKYYYFNANQTNFSLLINNYIHLDISLKKEINNSTYIGTKGNHEPIEFLPSININNRTFKNVLKVKGGGTDTTVFHFAENTGLVQFANKSDTFKLLKFEIK